MAREKMGERNELAVSITSNASLWFKVKYLYTENYKIPMRKIEEYTNKGKDILYKISWVISMDFLILDS
ncbi:hypothetical protein, partial [Klebsiella pneumoniae]|uniref:hypothetical protein n=1 Tax=Klebsiella pneumoniae TaxID=573 RepID=UPI0030093E40